jgi:hypothetical protein
MYPPEKASGISRLKIIKSFFTESHLLSGNGAPTVTRCGAQRTEIKSKRGRGFAFKIERNIADR